MDCQEGSIYYQVLHDRVPRQISTLYKVLPEEWDGKRGNVVIPKDFERKAYLKKTDLTGSRLVYCRRKTGQRLVIKWTAEMQDIVDKYPPNASYLLPIIKATDLKSIMCTVTH